MFDKIIIPQAVKDECKDFVVLRFIRSSFVQVKPVSLLLFDSLGKGEREAVSLAVEEGIKTIILDDKKGWNKALEYGLEPIQTITVLELAKDMGLIPSVKEMIHKLIENGEGITKGEYLLALKMAGEA